jgi:hypothetical protein
MKKNNYYQKLENICSKSIIRILPLNIWPGTLAISRKSLAIKTFLVADILIISINQVIVQKQHPYLFYTLQRVNLLKERIKTIALIAANWNALEQRCDNWLEQAAGGCFSLVLITQAIRNT